MHHELFGLFTAKVTMRQAARMTGAARGTVTRRMRAMGLHCKAWHGERLAESRGAWFGTFLMDELETFETDRLTRPVTVPVLIQRRSLFVVHAEAAPLPPRGRLDAYRTLRKLRDEAKFGKRRSGSRAAVERTLLTLSPLLHPSESLNIATDRKSSYRKLIRTHYWSRFGCHAQESSKTKRGRANVLFPINHTLAMLRDGVSRLVRRSWGASKRRDRLEDHLWIWIAYRNYVRDITVSSPGTTPAMAAGVLSSPLGPSQIFRWRFVGQSVTDSRLGQHLGGGGVSAAHKPGPVPPKR